MKKLWNIFLILAIIGIIGIRFTYTPQKSENNLFVDGVVAAMLDWQPCVVNKNGEIVAKFDEADAESGQLGSFTPDGIAVYYTDFYYLPSELPAWMQGYVNTKGEMITEAEFTYAGDFNNGLAVVRKDDKCGIINKDMEYVIEPRFDSLKAFENDKYAPAKIGDKWGYINKSGDFVITPQFDDAASFAGKEVARVEIDGKIELIDRKGNMVGDIASGSIKTPYGDVTVVNDVEVRKSGRKIPHYSLLNIKTGEFTPLLYERIEEFNENGLARAYKFAKWGFINTKGEEVIECKYREVSDFENGLAIVHTMDKTWGYINTKGEMVKEFGNYSRIGHFKNGLAWFQTGDKLGYMNERFEVVIEPKFYYNTTIIKESDPRDFYDDGYAIVRYDSENSVKYGVIDKDGNFIIEPIYDYIG